jgi:putative ribosome biogenesis GTPase RsgA
VPPAYVNTFRAVPQAGNIAPQDRDLTDMDDAMAQDNLMMLKESDQAQDLQLQLANQIESLVGNPSINISAPGSSSLITAAAVAGEIQSQAVTQKKRHASHTTTPSENAMPPTQDNCKRT